MFRKPQQDYQPADGSRKAMKEKVDKAEEKPEPMPKAEEKPEPMPKAKKKGE